MAEKITIGEVDIDMEKVLADTIKLKQEVGLLTSQTKKAKEETGEMSAEYIQYSASLKATKNQLRSHEQMLSKAVEAENSEIGSLDKLKAQLSLVSKQWSLLSEDERANTEEGQKLTKQKKDLTEALKKEESATGDNRRKVGDYTGGIIEAIAQLKNKESELKKNLLALESVKLANKGNAEEEEKATLAIEQNKYELVKVNQELKKYGQNLDITDAEIVNVSEGTNKFTGSLDGLPGPLGSAVTGIKSMTKAAMTFIATPLGMIIAAIVAGLAALSSYFKRSEEGQNALSKATAVFSTVLNNVLDIVDKVGEAIFKAFEDPKQAVKDLWEAIKANIVNRFTGLVDQFKALGKVIEGVFSGSMEKIKEGAKEFGESYIQTLTGVDDAINKTKNALKGFIEEQQKEIAIAQRIADKKAALDKKERESMVLTSKERLKLEKLKNEVDDKNNFTAEERLKKIDEENAIYEKQINRLLDIAKQKYQIKVAQDSLSNSTKEDLEEEARLLADIYNIEADITARKKESIAKRIEAENTLKEEQRAAAEEAVANMENELAMWQLKNKSKLESTKQLNQELVDEEIERLNSEAEKEKEILGTKLANKLLSEQEYALQLETLEQEKNEAIKSINDEYQQQLNDARINSLIERYEKEKALQEETLFEHIKRQKEALEQERLNAIANAEKTGADVNKINERYDKAEKSLDKASNTAKLQLASDLAGNLSSLFEENTIAYKASASAQALINTYLGATAAFAQTPGGVVIKSIAAAMAVASGLKSVQQIWAVNTKGTASSSASASSSPVSSTASASLSTSSLTSAQTSIGNGIVSRGTTNDISETTNSQPVLVVDDVTKAQNYEAQKVKASTL